jgi:hypothetical protein
MIAQRGVNERAIAGQLCRDRGVRSGSEKAIAKTRSKCGDQLALPWRERRLPTHHRLSERREVLRPMRFVIEEMKNLRHWKPGIVQRGRRFTPRALGFVMFHVLQKHGANVHYEGG